MRLIQTGTVSPCEGNGSGLFFCCFLVGKPLEFPRCSIIWKFVIIITRKVCKAIPLVQPPTILKEEIPMNRILALILSVAMLLSGMAIPAMAEGADADNIVALNQNEVKKISVLVYLDGNVIDNSAVSNATTSGALNLNLQFSSSANLIPMQNTALQQLTSYTVTFDANGGTGLMTAAKVSGTSYTLPTSTSFYAPAGKEFKGWGATADATEAALITTLDNLSENVTVYAVWGEPAAVEPDAGEGNDEGDQTTTPTAMTAVTCAEATVADASFTDQVISFKLTDADSNAITSGTVTVTTASGTVNASYANDVWSATVTDTLAADTAVTVTYTATSGT